jgi:hypothetical protein
MRPLDLFDQFVRPGHTSRSVATIVLPTREWLVAHSTRAAFTPNQHYYVAPPPAKIIEPEAAVHRRHRRRTSRRTAS